MFEWRLPGDSLLDIALDHLTLGRAALYEAILERSAAVPAAAASRAKQAPSSPVAPSVIAAAAGETPALQTARRELDAAVAGLRRAGTQHYIPARAVS